MIAAFFHFSDMHVREQDQRVGEWIEKIPCALYDQARQADECFVILSGDLAFSGKESEYQLVSSFLKAVRDAIKEECVGDVHFIMAPGNHDCDLSEADKVRDVVIERIVKDNVVEDQSLIDLCTGVQNNYRQFSEDWHAPSHCSYKDKLVEKYCFQVGGKKLSFVSINVAWMSRIKERQGEMVFPAASYREVFESKDSDFSFCIMHHPLNWYSQGSYHDFRSLIQRSFNGVFSGHEHVYTTRHVSEVGGSSAVFFEAFSLGPEDEADPGFSSVRVDLDTGRFSIRNHVICDGSVQGFELKSGELGEKKATDLDFDAAFKRHLLDPGGSFKHPEKDSLTSEDIFVYPEVKRGTDDGDKFINSSSIDYSERKKVMFLGDDKSGKTFLLKHLMLDFHETGFFPIFIDASSIKSVSDAELDKRVRRAASHCYGNHCRYYELNKSKRVVLIDDIDRLPGKNKNKLKLLSWLDRSFDKIIITGSVNIQLGEYLDEEVSEAFLEYCDYRIQDFGYKLRHALIKKWCECGDIETKKELDKRVHGVEYLINAVIGKNLVPARPIYLLILIQSNESQQHRELESASLAFYYQFLITKSLTEAGWPKEQLNEIFNYLSHMAWRFRECGTKELNEDQLKGFNDDFNDSFTRVDYQQRVELLLEAKILGLSHGCYSFLYPYVYYFFIGKYLSSKINHDQAIRSTVIDMCGKLYRRENANSVLFLSHHAGDTWLADQVLGVLSNCFSESKPIEFNGDTSSLNELVESSSHVYLGKVDVEKNQLEKRQHADQVDRRSDEDDFGSEGSGSDEDRALDFSVRMNLLFKTTEILGQVVKTYYGSINRIKKKDYLEGVFDGPLRMLGFLFKEILEAPELFVNEVERNISDSKRGLLNADLEAQARKVAFDLIGMICTGTVVRTAQFVDSDKISDDLSGVVEEKPSNAYRLIQCATGLLKPGGIDYPNLSRLARDLEDDIFPFKILQTLVVNHIHMFHTSDQDKQRLSSIAKITIDDARSVDFKNRSGKTLRFRNNNR